MVDPLLTKQEAASYLRVSPQTLDNYRRRGIIMACKVGRKVLFKESDLFKALKTETTKA